MAITLPTQKVNAITGNPKTLVIFSKPKVGKTTLLSQLDNCLIIDTENGSDYVSALKVKVHSVDELRELCTEIIKAGKPYKYIAIDTLTSLEEMCKPYAEQLYMSTSMGKTWIVYKEDENGKKVIDIEKSQKPKIGDILNLAQGGGYLYLRKAVTTCLGWLKMACDNNILVCHLKEKLWNDNGLERSSNDLQLTGLIKSIVTRTCDSIGYMHRVGKKNMISFVMTDDEGSGSRIEHLSNKDIFISEFDDQGNYITHWDLIYKPELENLNNNN